MVSPTKRPGMIVTRTPLRVSFAGGGTDFPDFYEQGYGAVLSTAINKYVYVTVKRHGELFNEKYRLNYSETEQVCLLEEIENEIARECLCLLQVEPPIYISVIADLPAFSGLGSSSSFAVGLLHALHVYRGESVSVGQLAEEAAHIEIDVLKRPMGKQDQYAAAFGGLNYISFLSDGGVSLEPQHLSKNDLKDLFDSIMMFWTGIMRDSSSVLMEQKSNTAGKMDYLIAMREYAQKLRAIIRKGFDLQAFGLVLDANWQLKCHLASSITNSRIDKWYQRAMNAGALGGKLCGAGGGGFLLFIVKSECQEDVRQALADLTEVSLGYETQGSQLLFAL